MFIIFSYYDIFDRVICITHFGLHGACLSHFVVVSIQVSSHYELHYDMYLVLMWGNAQEPDDVLMAYRTVEINCIFILKLSKGCQYSPKKMFSIIMVKSPLINRMFSIIMVKSPLINRMFSIIMVQNRKKKGILHFKYTHPAMLISDLKTETECVVFITLTATGTP